MGSGGSGGGSGRGDEDVRGGRKIQETIFHACQNMWKKKNASFFQDAGGLASALGPKGARAAARTAKW
eukprot:196618-Pyramimonas_sp.AAC.1